MEVAPLQRFIAQSPGTVVVIHDPTLAHVAARLDGDVVRHCADRDGDEAPGRWGGVLALFPDAAALRRTVSAQPRIGRTRNLACWLLEADRPVLVTARPEWPAIASITARVPKSNGSLTVLRFEKFVLANAVLEQIARGAGTTLGGNGGVVVAAPDGTLAVPVDPSLVRSSGESSLEYAELAVPPDVLLTDAAAHLPAHHVIDRAPLQVSPVAGLAGPVDEGVLNPTGFLQQVDGTLLTLEAEGERLLLRGDGVEVSSSPDRGATAAIVSALRPHRGVRIGEPHISPRALASTVAGLAAAGVPVQVSLSEEAAALLGPRLRQVLRDDLDLGESLRREEYSIRLRRAALLEHSTRAWRERLAAEAGVAFRRFPTVSVLLATKRPDMVDHALREVAKQRGEDLDLELVLVTHGFEVDAARVRAAVPNRDVVVHSMPGEAFFGDVLNAALDRASGDLVVKMDDDDWYGPDFLLDLLLAREYSGADVLGVTGEYVYLEPLDRTIRRTDDSERAAKFVAGGSMLLGRSFLRELGGFRRVRKYVDAQLLAAVHSMGGHVYRGHGLGYMLRRNSTGHTWDPGLDYYLAEKRLARQWEGFVPSRILEFDEVDRPHPRVERDG